MRTNLNLRTISGPRLPLPRTSAGGWKHSSPGLPCFLLVLILAACSVPAGAWGTSTPSPQATATSSPTSYTAGNSDPTPTPAAFCEVSGGHVNVRSGPGMSFPVLFVVARGDRLQLTHPQPLTGWVEIRAAAGQSGYFYAPTWCKED